MAKVKKMALGGISSIGDMIKDASQTINNMKNSGGISGGIGGGSASDGLNQINAGASTVGNAIGNAQGALGGGGSGGGMPSSMPGGGSGSPPGDELPVPKFTGWMGPLPNNKKGGSVKKRVFHNKVSTSAKNKKHPNW
jgi:hypothetical protein